MLTTNPLLLETTKAAGGLVLAGFALAVVLGGLRHPKGFTTFFRNGNGAAVSWERVQMFLVLLYVAADIVTHVIRTNAFPADMTTHLALLAGSKGIFLTSKASPGMTIFQAIGDLFVQRK